MTTSNNSIFQINPQDVIFKTGVNDVLANTNLTPAAQATIINNLIGGTYGGDTSKAYAAFGGANLDAATKSAYDTFLAKGQPYVTPAANDFKSTATNILNNQNLSPEARATAINLALISNNLTREQGALQVDPYAYGTTAGMNEVNAFLNKGGAGAVGGGVPSSLTGAVDFINKNLGLQEVDLQSVISAMGLDYNPITDILYNPTTKEATKIDVSKLGTTYYGADNPLTKEVENYAPGTPGYIQAFINRLATDNPTLTPADFRQIAEAGFKIPAGSFRPDSSGNTRGSIVIGGVTYTIPKGSTSTVVGGTGNDTLTGGTGNDFQSTLVGGSGVDFKGSTGLREAYGPYVIDYLSRISALLAARDAENYKPRKFGTKAKGTEQDFTPYGTDTADLLEELAKERKTKRTAPHKGRKFSFAKTEAAKGGIMSLIEGYDAGGTVGNTANTVVGGTGLDSTYANQTVPSTYTAPSNTYTGPGAAGITTEQFSQANLDRFINPFTTSVIDPQVREAKRQAELTRQSQAAKFAQAGAFGGSGRILAEQAIGRNLATQVGDIYGRGQKEAFDTALKGFEAEQSRRLTADIETERARQEAGRQGLTGASNEAQFQQQARELQQRAEEAQARGDQFAADLALRELQESQRAAEATRLFEYQQERDLYLDPFREALYASQALSGLPISASSTGISPATEAIISMLGLSNVLKPGG